MKKLLFILLFLPLHVLAQYEGKDFCLRQDGRGTDMSLRLTAQADTAIELTREQALTGLGISGQVEFQDRETGFVRITLEDDAHFEYLVYENYPLLADTYSPSFSRAAVETMLLNGVRGGRLRITVQDATLHINTIHLCHTPVGEEVYAKETSRLSTSQVRQVAERLNRHLIDRGLTWRAGVTSVAELCYEEKKAMFGGTMPALHGFDYYVGGYFVMPGYGRSESNTLLTQEEEEEEDPYVSEWDWRNRHGKNWMTSVKNQGGCNSCWAFAAAGTIESYINLYYNQLLDYDLSEQEFLSCISYQEDPCSNGGSANAAFNYTYFNGVVKEIDFPYQAQNSDCSLKSQNPHDIIYINGFVPFSGISGDSLIKKNLFRAPLVYGSTPWWHLAVLVGYKKIMVGDSVCVNPVYGQGGGTPMLISAGNPVVGETAWLIKNSLGTNWGYNGFGYIIEDLTQTYYTSLRNNIISNIYSDSDIVCEDADSDGYYFWGIGDKPASCPAWVPDEPDGDDSNADNGPLNQYGHLRNINPDLSDTIYIDTDSITTQLTHSWQHIVVRNNAHWNISADTYLHNGAKIFVRSGSTLTIDSVSVRQAQVFMEAGSQLNILNGGELRLRQGFNLYAPLGAIVNMQSGYIKNE